MEAMEKEDVLSPLAGRCECVDDALTKLARDVPCSTTKAGTGIIKPRSRRILFDGESSRGYCIQAQLMESR